MAKGMRVKLNYHVSRDPDTGAEVTRLTPPEVTCHRNYFYQKCFFNDGSHLLFAGEFDGHWNYYLLNIASAVGGVRFVLLPVERVTYNTVHTLVRVVQYACYPYPVEVPCKASAQQTVSIRRTYVNRR